MDFFYVSVMSFNWNKCFVSFVFFLFNYFGLQKCRVFELVGWCRMVFVDGMSRIVIEWM